MYKASVIIPCRNSERFIDATLESVFAQSMQDFEVICIDNMSTDRTAEMLESWAAGHSNMQVLTHEGMGFRNPGLAIAQGEWLYFLDSDDLMAPTLLEKAIAAGERHDADVVVFKTEEMDDVTGALSPAEYAFDTSWLPEGVLEFSPQEFPEHLFNSFQNWTWNKLFSTSFVRDHDIVFGCSFRAEDLAFTCQALAEARLIALLPERLHRYRVNNPSSASQTSDAAPDLFLDGFYDLKQRLEGRGLFETYRDSFVNWAMSGITYNMYLQRGFESFELLAKTLKGGALEALGIVGYPRERAYDTRHWDDCNIILNEPIEKIAFRYLQLEKGTSADLRSQLMATRNELAGQQERLEEMQRLLDEISAAVSGAEEKPHARRHHFRRS